MCSAVIFLLAATTNLILFKILENNFLAISVNHFTPNTWTKTEKTSQCSCKLKMLQCVETIATVAAPGHCSQLR